MTESSSINTTKHSQSNPDKLKSDQHIPYIEASTYVPLVKIELFILVSPNIVEGVEHIIPHLKETQPFHQESKQRD